MNAWSTKLTSNLSSYSTACSSAIYLNCTYTCILYDHDLFPDAQVQVATSQQVLVVELIQFYNMYNAEVINGQYCCCDKSEKCASQLENLPKCKSKCDTWFNVTLSPCHSPYSCSAATVAHCNSASLHNLDYKFEFLIRNSSDTVSVNNLRTRKP